MKRVSVLLTVLALGLAWSLTAQDAATEERLNKLSGRIDDLMAGQETIRKQLTDLTREIQNVREQASKPTGNYASQEDLTRLKKAVEEVDRKRIDDADKVHTELLKLRKVLETPLPPPPTRKTTAAPKEKEKEKDTSVSDKPVGDEKVFPYVVQSDDTLSVIAQAYRKKNIKVTVDQILKANPGLNEKKLKVGQTIYIPAPPQ
jgi:LysM repeat protein